MNERLIQHLEYTLDIIENPLYNSLEVGFRHNPLTKDEKLSRYEDACSQVKEQLFWILCQLKDDAL